MSKRKLKVRNPHQQQAQFKTKAGAHGDVKYKRKSKHRKPQFD